MPVKPVPDGYHSVTAYLIVQGAGEAIAFYEKAFGARELFRLAAPGGKVGHAEIQIGDTRVMLADEYPEMGAKAPGAFGGSPVSMLIYTADADAMFAQAIAAGAKELRPMTDQYYGDRMGTLVDPFGHQWTIGVHIEDVSIEEVQRRFEAAAKDA